MLTPRSIFAGLILLLASGLAAGQDVTAEMQKLTAKRCAEADAYAKLAETVYGLQINSHTYVKDFVTESDEIRTSVDSFVQGVRLGQPTWYADGSCEVPAEVTVAKVIETLRTAHSAHYHGDSVSTADFDSLTRRIDKKIFQVIGMGAPRPDLRPDLPVGVVEMLGPPPGQGLLPPIPQTWLEIGPQARLSAQRAARRDAQRRLAERIKGLRLTARTQVRDFVVESDEITADLDTFLINAEENGGRNAYYLHEDELIAECTLVVPTEQVISTVKTLHARHYRGDDVHGTDIDRVVRTVVKRDFEATGMGIPNPKFIRKYMETTGATMPEWCLRTLDVDGEGTDPQIQTAQGKLRAARAAEMDARRRLPRAHRPAAQPGGAPGRRRALGPGVQHRRGDARHRPRGPDSGTARRLPDRLHLFRSSGDEPDPGQGHDQAGGTRCRNPHFRLCGGRSCGCSSRPISRPPTLSNRWPRGPAKGSRPSPSCADARILAPACAELIAHFDQPGPGGALSLGPRIYRGHRGARGRGPKFWAPSRSICWPAPNPRVYSYVNKEQCEERVVYRRVQPQDDPAVADVEAISLAAWRALGCRDAGRIDIRCDENGRAQFLEVNPLGRPPSRAFGPADHLPSRRECSYRELIARIVDSAALRVRKEKSQGSFRPPIKIGKAPINLSGYRKRVMLIVVLHNAVAADAPPDERDVLVQAEAVTRGLAARGHKAETLGCTLDLSDLRRRLDALGPDAVFNLVEGLDGQSRLLPVVPAAFEAWGRPFTGSGSAALWVTTHKVMAKERLAAAGIDTPEWVGPFPAEMPWPGKISAGKDQGPRTLDRQEPLGTRLFRSG